MLCPAKNRRLRLSCAGFRAAQQDLIVRVVQACFAVNIAQDAIAATDAQFTAPEEQLRR